MAIEKLKSEEYDNWLTNFGYIVEYKKAPNIFTSKDSCPIEKALMTPAVLSFCLRDSFVYKIISANYVASFKSFIQLYPDTPVLVWKGSML